MKTILDGLKECECRWPIGRETGLHQRFCCMDVTPGRSYCEKHLAEAYGATPRDVRPPIKLRMVGRGYKDPGRSGASENLGHHRPPVDELIRASVAGIERLRSGSLDIQLRGEHQVEVEME